MPLIALFSGDYCQAEPVISEVLRRTGYRRVDDAALIDRAGEAIDTPREKMKKVFSADEPGFNKFTHEKGLIIARLKLVLAQVLTEADDLLLYGFLGQLVPRRMAHALRICLVADTAFRAAASALDRGISVQAAKQLIHLRDDDCAAWLQRFYAVDDPWDPSLYDLVAATDTTTPGAIADRVVDALGSKMAVTPRQREAAVREFLLAARVEVAMFGAGHDVQVEARDAAVTLKIHRSVLLLEQLERELAAIVKTVPGVESVQICENG